MSLTSSTANPPPLTPPNFPLHRTPSISSTNFSLLGNSLMEFCKCTYSLGAPLNVAPRIGTTRRMKNLAAYPMIPLSSPGSLNSKIANLPPPYPFFKSGFLSTRRISQRAAVRSGTLRMPKAMVTASYDEVFSPSRLRASPIRSVTVSVRDLDATFSIPTSSMERDGSIPSTEVAAAAAALTSAALSARSMATSAVPVAKSNIFTAPPPPPSLSFFANNIPSSVTPSTISLLHPLSIPNARALFVKSYLDAMESNIEPVPKSVGGGCNMASRVPSKHARRASTARAPTRGRSINGGETPPPPDLGG
mmetsp:Transcript_23017/g.46707  ORF Transcript_23017/g.46707 Transcript_23017/m.46707 type:complete len:306 (-) Transcript_23017:269-1186(-)